MARLTVAQLVAQGGVLAGNDAAPTWVTTKFNAWLRKHYAAWAWPFLIKQATGIILPAGVASLDVGAGNGGLTPQISRIFSPIYFRANGFNTRGKAPVRQLVGGPASAMNGNFDATSKGQPQAFTTSPQSAADGTQYQTLGVYPYTDLQYTLAFTYQQLPDDIASTAVPAYPNEMTLIQACKCAAIEYDSSNSPWFTSEEGILASMVTADRDAYGGNDSFGNTIQLDDAVFPTDTTYNPYSKMGN